MKKIFLMAALLVSGFIASYAIDYTATAFITMDGVTLKLRQSDSFNAGYNNGACVHNNNANGLSAYVNGERYAQWGEKNLDGLALEFNAAAANETLTFSDVIGDLYLVDNVAKQCKKIENGESYSFTATAGESVADRFYISKTEVIFQTEFVCQVAGGLSFHGDQAYNGLQVFDENDGIVEAAFDLAAGEDKLVDIANPGKYYILNGEQKIVFVVR